MLRRQLIWCMLLMLMEDFDDVFENSRYELRLKNFSKKDKCIRKLRNSCRIQGKRWCKSFKVWEGGEMVISLYISF